VAEKQMYKEEMDRLGFVSGGWFKKLAALGSFFDTIAGAAPAPPQTAYENLQDQANKKYKDRPADREMFDVTTNYLMEQEDRNIQDAELRDALSDVSRNYTNAEPEKFIQNYNAKPSLISLKKPKPTILSEQILSTIQKNRGWSSEELNALKEFSNSVSKAESDNKIDVHQHSGGPGRGKYQYEIGDEQGASTARNRLLNFAKDNNITIPQKYLNLLGQQGIQSIDFSALPEDLQTALFFADKAKHPEFKLDDLVSGRLSPVDAWLAYHWAGKQELREEKKQYFLDKNKLEKRSKLIPHPTTPIFTTQEEADAYIGGAAKGIRSAIRGVIQGVARYTGPADIAAYGKIMAPPRLGGIGTGPKFYQEPTSWLEEAQNFASGVGKTVVPGDVQEEGVMVSQEATGLVILGVGIKDAVRLIRHYGPKAVAKIKNYFVKNPESTVDEAAKGVLGKAATRRDVIKGMGTGAAVAGTAGVIGKASMLAKGTATAGTTITSGSLFRTINRIPREVLGKDFDKYIRHVYGNKKAKWIEEANEPNPAVLSKIKEIEKYFKKYGLNSKKQYSVMDDTTHMEPYIHADEGWTSVGDWRAGKRTPSEHIVYTQADDPVHIAYAQVDDIETAAFDIGIQNKLRKKEDMRIAEYVNKLKKEGKYTGKEKDIDLYYDSLTDDTQLMDLVSKQEIWDETLNEMIRASQKDYDPTAWNVGFKNSALRDNSKFLGEKNGIEFFEIDGMPVIRIKGMYSDSIILPNAQGIEKIAIRTKVEGVGTKIDDLFYEGETSLAFDPSLPTKDIP
jgi:hypothetical protein